MFFKDTKKRLTMRTIDMAYVEYVNLMPLSIMMMYFCIGRAPEENVGLRQ